MKKILFSLLMLMLLTSVYAYDCPANSYMNYDGGCSCNDGYTPNRNGDGCAKVTESLCYEKYGNFSRMASDGSKCTCLSGYGINAKGTSCEKITDSFCKNFMSDFVANKDGTDCMCKDGYSLDPDGKHCSKITDEWCEYMGPNAVLDKVEGENYRCKCKDGYHLPKNGLTCEGNTESYCKEEYGEASVLLVNKACGCKSGYSMDENGKKCVGDNEQKVSEVEDGEIVCPDGEVIDETKSKCVKDSLSQRKLNCNTWFGDKTTVSEDNIDICVCTEGYIWNETETKCIPYSAEQMKLNCTTWYGPHSIVAEYDKCNCEQGYTWSYDESFCDVNLDQKSLSSRMINTIDAKCDDVSVISNCEKDPTGDSCPAVCLEIYDALNWMYDNELTIYKDPTKFGLYNEITREQASKFFVNFYATLFDKELLETPENPFNDIANADPTLTKYILNANILGLFKGNKGKFMPFNHLTKAQTIAVTIRIIAGILDETVNPWFSNYVYKAESLDLLKNIKYSQSTLDSEDILRGDVALMLYRLYINLKYFS